jgi:hypothetical protein
MVTCQGGGGWKAQPPKSGVMASLPDGIALERHRELRGPGFNRPVRWVVLALLVALLLLGVFNVFGQRPETTTVHADAASLELYAPSRLRGGLLYEARFTINAHRDLKNALLQLSPGWNEGQQMNTIEPTPLGQGSRNGDLLFTLGHIPAGQKFRLFLQFQVNPTNVGRRTANVTLYDGGARLATIKRTVTVFP